MCIHLEFQIIERTRWSVKSILSEAQRPKVLPPAKANLFFWLHDKFDDYFSAFTRTRIILVPFVSVESAESNCLQVEAKSLDDKR
jgi:hypothetical protein